ncbi:MAG: T9SS type A sorting domain-containing protein [Bacteroidetes bacterium]|nr:T9SS type A sorting domain-containing protein [Bacteroidota bacterium]
MCAIAKKCQAYGDVFTFVRPNEDFVAMWSSISASSRRKINYNYLNSKTNLMNRNWAANCYIQMNALTKYLKGKYNKVIVLGLSSGSWGAFFSSLQSEPDAAQIASGYSMLFNDLSYGATADQLHFDGLFSDHPADSARAIIKNQVTQYLFSYGSGDAVTHMANENTNHITQNFFNTPDTLQNASYFYDFSSHRFPCEALDTFFIRVKKMPKASLQIVNTCLSDSAQLKISFIGTAPYSFGLMRNDTLVGNYTSSNDSMFITLFQPGNYTLHQLIDSNQVLGFKVNSIQYNQSTKLQINAISENYICHTDTTSLLLTYEGTAPYTVFYTANGSIVDSIVTSSTSHDFHFANGNYHLYMLKDANQCEVILNQTFAFDYQKLADSLSIPQYLCDSNVCKMDIHVQGNSPWNIQFMQNGLVQNMLVSDTFTHHYLNNGIYFFINVSDSTGCVESMNNYFVLTYDSLTASIASSQYVCDSNKLALPCSVTGNSPFILAYEKNGISEQLILQASEDIFLDNGNYLIHNITDATGCVIDLDTTFLVNYDTLSLQMSAPVFSCDSNKTRIQFQFQGNPPFTVFYLQDGISKSLSTPNNIIDAYFVNGNYFFNSVSDNTLCNATINTGFNFQSQALSASIVQQHYNCDSNQYEIEFAFTGNAPWVLEYTDGSSNFTQTINSTSFYLYLLNGNYTINKVTDATGCEFIFNQFVSVFYQAMNASIVSQGYDCDSNALKVSFALNGNAPWQITYIENLPLPIVHHAFTSNPNYALYLQPGIYILTEIADVTNCNVQFNQPLVNNYTNVSVNNFNHAYDCDSLKEKISFEVSGNAPWILTYQNNTSGIMYQVNSLNPVFSFYVNSGNYTILQLQDATCSLSLNDTLDLIFQPLQSTILPETLYCDLGKYVVTWVHTGGAKPYTIHYLANGNSVSITTPKDTTILYLANGLYYFGDIVDAFGCVIQHGHMVSISYNPFVFNGVSTKYLCDKDSTEITFDITNQQPVWLSYSKDGGPLDTLYFNPDTSLIATNGNYQWVSMYDGLGCADTINQHTLIHNKPAKVDSLYLEKKCIERTYLYHLKMQGASPFVLHYNVNNINRELTLNGNLAQWKAETGAYYLINIEDANGCEYEIGRKDTLIPFLASDPILRISNHHLNTPSPAQRYYWYKDDILMDSVNGHSRQSEGDGIYYVVVKDKAGCEYKSNEVTEHYEGLMNLYPNPVHDYTTLLINQAYGNSWKYAIMDVTGRIVESGKETKAYNFFDLRHLASGLYRVIITFENDNTRHILQFVKD